MGSSSPSARHSIAGSVRTLFLFPLGTDEACTSLRLRLTERTSPGGLGCQLAGQKELQLRQLAAGSWQSKRRK